MNMADTTTQKKSIVVLGAGFGGLRAAKLLARGLLLHRLTARYAVYLIDKNPYHTYTPTLYEIATTSKETANYLELKDIVAFDIPALIAGYPLTFVNDTVTALDLIGGDIHCVNTEMKFDYLVLAIGSETNYVDIPGLRAYALPLKSFMDAVRLRDTILERATAVPAELRIIIGGGGSTGVELAGELECWFGELRAEARAFPRTSVTIVEGSPTVLSGFAPRMIAIATKRLQRIGVQLIVNERIVSAAKDTVTLQSGKTLPYDILVWTGGVKAASLMSVLPLKREEKGRVEAQNAMECLPQTEDLKLYGKIYGLGDAVCVFDPVTKKPVPLVARAALLQADVAAENIIQDILAFEHRASAPAPRHYTPMEYPYVVPIGGKYAVAKIGPFVFSGILAWFFKGLIELYYLLSILPFWKAVRTWFKGLRIFLANDRLG
ncbi:MAG: FAD-dependent oxidoreductase [Candidatus Harrisonbacteria bacterium]|nr:FAD-dependent oxidoreductase [Candidatus Harrisonbacteria bacterium]